MSSPGASAGSLSIQEVYQVDFHEDPEFLVAENSDGIFRGGNDGGWRRFLAIRGGRRQRSRSIRIDRRWGQDVGFSPEGTCLAFGKRFFAQKFLELPCGQKAGGISSANVRTARFSGVLDDPNLSDSLLFRAPW